MSETFECITPIDGSVYVTRNYASEEEIATVLDAAQAATHLWKMTSIAERSEICLAAVNALLSNKEAIAEEITWQIGRPIRYAAGEINGFEERARYMIGIAETKLQDIHLVDRPGFKRFIQREPHGVVFSVTPWNYPYLTAVNSVIPALMAGNVVIMKTSKQTPLVSERLGQAFEDAGLPKGIFQYLHVNHDDTTKIIKSGKINYIAFTGSTAGGVAIEHAAAGQFLELALELGGKDPAYVRCDADLNYSVENLVDGSFFNSGQSCCGIERIYVHQDNYHEFIERFVATVNQYKLGNPLDHETTLGPMVSVNAANNVRHQINNTIHVGGKAWVDCKGFSMDDGEGAYLSPQVFTDVAHDMSIMRNESFGPVVGIMPVDNDEQAIEMMNQSQYGLTASIWTKDENKALALGDQLQFGTIFMNRCDYLDPGLAWTGCKKSGKGCSLSEVGYERLTRPKSFHFKEMEEL